MKNKLQKTKGWLKNHSSEICFVLFCGGLLYTGYVVGQGVYNFEVARGLKKFHEAGFIKFFDESTGAEVDVEEVCGLIKDHFNL